LEIFDFCTIILNKISNFGGKIAKKISIKNLKKKLLGSKNGAQCDVPCSRCGAFLLAWHVSSSAILSGLYCVLELKNQKKILLSPLLVMAISWWSL
jgi:hypothetical protein